MKLHDRVRLTYGSRCTGRITSIGILKGVCEVRWDSGLVLRVDLCNLEPESAPIKPQVKLEPRKPREVIHRRAGAGRPQKFVERHCAQCKQPMQRKRMPQRLESIRDFMERKYCSKDCHSAGMSGARAKGAAA